MKKHQDMVLIVSAVLFLGTLAAMYVWTVHALLANLNQAFGGPNTNHVSSGFDFETARKILSERGLEF